MAQKVVNNQNERKKLKSTMEIEFKNKFQNNSQALSSTRNSMRNSKMLPLKAFTTKASDSSDSPERMMSSGASIHAWRIP